MNKRRSKIVSLLTATAMCIGVLSPATVARAEGKDLPLVGDISVEHFKGDEGNSDVNNFIKLSHPKMKSSKMEFDPKKDAETRKKHEETEVFVDGVIEYLGNEAVGEPSLEEGAKTVGDRGQSYSWAGFAYGDWMYVSTLFNSTESTGRLLGQEADPKQLDEQYGGDLFIKEPDDTSTGGKPEKVSGSTLTKVNVKTGETKIIMSKSKNGLEPSFRNAVEYHEKLYFCGSVNHLPAIYEVDPKTDAFQCVYQDPSIRNHPGGPGAAYKESLDKGICPTIRGLSVFKDYLVISTVGTDGNPYIAVSQNPTKGFTTIAKTWADADKKVKGELLGYPACRLQDSIMGGSIWEMVEYNDSLYVAICTGTPENAPKTHEGKADDDGNKPMIIDTMQSFAIIRGDFNPGTEENPNKVSDAEAWKWTPVVGDKENDGAKYTFGIDPERTRASACNLVVFKDHLYVGEYNDTQIAFKNMVNSEMDYLIGNLDQSVSLYRMDQNEEFEKVMGDPTKMFPDALSGVNESGFGKRESQYIWQSKVYDGKLYLGTFDETMILNPLAKAAEDMMNNQNKGLKEEVNELNAVIDEVASTEVPTEETETFALEENTEDIELAKSLLDVRSLYETKKEAGLLSEFAEIEGVDPFILLPSEYYDIEPLVTVDSPENLYLAMLAINDLLEDEDSYSTREQLAAFIQYEKMYDEIVAYTENDEVPVMMSDSASLFAEDTPQREEIKDLGGVIKYLQNAIAGFDMYVSEDGVHFECITRKGMDDPYNQGLRVFAANDDENNSWMCIGTANPFYGTQLWRMEGGKLKVNPIDEKQIRVQIQFVDQEGEVVPRQKDKAGEIYVVESQKTIVPEDIEIMVPDNNKLKNPTKAVDIKPGNTEGTYTATVEVTSKYKDVQVKFVDSDKAESGNLVSTAPVRVKDGATTILKSKIEAVMPSGYILTDADAEIKIIENTEGDKVSYSASVPVKRAYEVNVVSGKASTYKAPSGTEVTITADKRRDQNFTGWKTEDGVEFKDASAAQTTFVMPSKNVTVEATYKEAAATYPVTVENGEGSGRYEEGTEVKIKATVPEGMIFTGWTSKNGVEFADPNAVETTFIMPSYGVKVTAGYREELPYFDVVVEGGEGSGSYEAKTEVAIKATVPEGKVFVNWTSEDEEVKFADAKAEETTFVMPEKDVKIKAEFKDIPHTGWNEENGKWYYYDENLNTVTGWQAIGGNWFYFYENGQMAADEFVDGCYLDENGYMARGWKFIHGNWYYFNASGFMEKGWFMDESNRWAFADENGHMVSNQFVGRCYLGKNGYMAIGWEIIDENWYYFKSNGYMALGWEVINGENYLFDNNGIMQVGVSPDGYLLESSGKMVTNSWAYVDGKWYYSDSNGRALKNQWKWIGGYCYYFYNDGHMAADEMTPDGSYVDASGHWIEDKPQAGRFRRAVYSLFH